MDCNLNGLDFFGARYLSSAQGRFTSPDPLGAGAGREEDPQSWNLYAYGRNNPLKYVDPLGLTYQVCDTNGNCSNLDDATFEKERKAGARMASISRAEEICSILTRMATRCQMGLSLTQI
jgi:RHS repeat-associated protein